MRSSSWATGDSWETHRTHAIHSPWITFALPAAPPAFAFPSPVRPGSVRAAEAAAVKCLNREHLRGNTGSSLFSAEWLSGLPEDHAPSGAPALALYPLPASRRPIRTQLGAPKSRASGPRFLPPCTRPSRGSRRSLPVVPSIRIEGTTGRLRWGYGGMSGRSGTLFPPFHRKQRRTGLPDPGPVIGEELGR